LLYRIPQFSEPTVGCAFDNDLDTGTAKPLVWVDQVERDGVQIIKVWRGFSRGEFGPWFEWQRPVLSHQDIVIQRTLGFGPTVVQNFLKKTGESQMKATHFDKVFANLQHDLREDAHDLFYLGWRPYKYGPVPVVPVVSSSGEFMEFQRFLVDTGCLIETKERHGTQVWRRYSPASDVEVPWHELYKLRTGSVTRSHVAGLVRLYAAIQKECDTTRPSTPGVSSMSFLQDPLVVLSAARNEKIAYTCGWFEVHDWRAKGELLFALLGGIATVQARSSKPFLKKHLEDFAAAARLLFDKIEMYRNLPYLRQQIVNLLSHADFEAGEVLLETIDPSPKFDAQSEWPMRNLEWACRIMRAFSSMIRQVLTPCGLDVDERTGLEKIDDKGLPKDAFYYLNELLINCPELRVLEDDLRTGITDSAKGYLTEDISKCLFRTFSFILEMFDQQQRIPDPRPQCERNRERCQARSDIVTALKGIEMPQPYALAISDIKNLRHLPRLGDILGISYEDAMDNLLLWVEKIARDVAKRHANIHFGGRTADSIILVGLDVDEVYLSTLDLIKDTTRCLCQIDYNQFALFGLLRTGIAWRDDRMSDEYIGVQPGLAAYELANIHGQALGAINVTKAVLDRLSAKHRSSFKPSSNGCRQGKVFVRYWESEKDMP